MSHRIRPDLVRAVVRPVLRLAVFVRRVFRPFRAPCGPVPSAPPAPAPAVEAPVPGLAPVSPLHCPGRRVHPYPVSHERYGRRVALARALDGIGIGPWAIHRRTVGVPLGVAV
ncbi:hypothetical protein [Streptomyces sp. SP18CS02]|uniref:hypothetical protein n=1 Tax=Streptomyces sp. SP18CS02 TaxID=3002531 RepID=UPI002E789980|nr:hypothetical protein [Streptomyces sp. SP18CS02]MEE1753482.1 hypothetical protein [Streptomyces sp. SP18CS02]